MICSSSTLFCFPSLHSLVFIRLTIFRVQIKKRQAYSHLSRLQQTTQYFTHHLLVLFGLKLLEFK